MVQFAKVRTMFNKSASNITQVGQFTPAPADLPYVLERFLKAIPKLVHFKEMHHADDLGEDLAGQKSYLFAEAPFIS